jgi:ABC-2 type transport system permease protein
MSSVNLIGLRTLFLKEVRRFLKVWIQTVFSPIVTTSLYFLVFGVALGSRLSSIQGVRYIEFVVPGLVMLAMINNAFLNSSSSFLQSKMNGTITRLLSAPIGATEILIAYVGAAMVRALMVGGLVYAVAALFVGVHLHDAAAMLFFALSVSAVAGVLGLLVGIQAERFDYVSAVPSFVLTPLTFLGGVFYAVDMLPEPWRTISLANPILYMVNGLRYSMLGMSDVPILHSVVMVLTVLAALVVATLRVLVRGKKLRP